MADLPIEETADGLAERLRGRDIAMAVSPIQAAGTSEDVAAGSNHTLLLVRGTVWAWGNNTYGQIGTGGSGSAPQGSPVQVPGLPAIKAISAGGCHFSWRLDASGSNVRAWGQNRYGQIGTGSASSVHQATPVAGPGACPRSVHLRRRRTRWRWTWRGVIDPQVWALPASSRGRPATGRAGSTR